MQCGLVGKSLSHSCSPKLHRLLWGGDYGLLPIEESALPDFFKKRDFSVVNVTLPYKQAVMPFLDEIDERARRIGSVNTVVHRTDGRTVGYNTDYDGFAFLAKRAGISFAGKKVLIFGSGGTAKTVFCVAEDAKSREIVVVSRSGPVTYADLDAHRDAEILVNATPLGMTPNEDAMPANPADFPKCIGVLDVVYNPILTKFILAAKNAGIPAMGGLPMLVGQAVAAMPLFCGKIIPDDKAEEVLGKLAFEYQNIVLVGMPGSGKTTLGRRLAAALGRPFVDTDNLVMSMSGKKIAEIFEEEGEAAFRRMEEKAVALASAQAGAVISVGGGGILSAKNRQNLAKRGRFIFINRPLEDLTRRGRPLSSDENALTKLAAERMPLYQSLCHDEFENIRSFKHSLYALKDLVESYPSKIL